MPSKLLQALENGPKRELLVKGLREKEPELYLCDIRRAPWVRSNRVKPG
jgi:hypothetical protein